MPLDTRATMQHYLFILSFLRVLRIDKQNPAIAPGFLLPDEGLKSPGTADIFFLTPAVWYFT
ncbi:hypothetical protein C1S65_16635 [Pseudomonas putida]|uniref:Uncharacterized protein n=1 Tax=Pseudomonas putida TaxID=303 RepID=A0AAD0L702_PSEPU|nr:hypothetical protein C1S65_16635 [Pseudomonas putida]